jgi:hypothetical protein
VRTVSPTVGASGAPGGFGTFTAGGVGRPGGVGGWMTVELLEPVLEQPATLSATTARRAEAGPMSLVAFMRG